MTWRFRGFLSVLTVVLLAASAGRASQVVADFDDLTLAPNSHWAGNAGGVPATGPFGPVSRNTFTSHGVGFINDYSDDGKYTSWSGFAYSNQGDTTTPGFGNQFSAYAGSGRGPGADNFGVGFGYSDVTPTKFNPVPFDPTDAAQLNALPTLILPTGAEIVGLYVTNTTYAALSMKNGDGFAKKFGGVNGTDKDWFKLTAYGTDASGNALSSFVEFYLADYRTGVKGAGYIVDDWRFMDLSALSGASRIHFNVSSSDVSVDWGMKTPGTFAVDDILYNANQSAVPEPSSLALLGIGAVGVGVVARRRRRAG